MRFGGCASGKVRDWVTTYTYVTAGIRAQWLDTARHTVCFSLNTVMRITYLSVSNMVAAAPRPTGPNSPTVSSSVIQ